MSASSGINYSRLFGIESVVAAAVFAALYVLFFVWFVCQFFRKKTYAFVLLASFCAIRIAAFIIRAVLARLDSSGHNLGLLVGDETLFDVGFFVLLYSAHTIVLDLTLFCASLRPTSVIGRLAASRKLFRIATTAAVAFGIYGVSQSQSSNPHTINLAKAFRMASAIIFLVLTVLQTYQTLRLTQVEIPPYQGDDKSEQSQGMKHGSAILCVISLLLLVRQVFATVTTNDTVKQYNEHFWYPLSHFRRFSRCYCM
ncbi:hypothetical protein BD779DRAFT_1610892 [Infundibulicybe gibba]|nr:hypothetical protein BD779DRAFT_1610892 [Infundibulicybe gibba]